MSDIEKRTCATCCSWADGMCMNLVSIPDHSPDDSCEFHETEAEYTADVKALKRFWGAIGLSARRGEAT
jgi:hypothetical protein